MARRAEVRLAGPRSPGERLHIHAVHPEHPNAGTIELAVAVNGIPVGRARIRDNRSGRHLFALPAGVVGVEEMTVTLEVNKTYKIPPDTRELGLAFGVVELAAPDGR